MFWEDHAPPHFHAEYGYYRALVDIKSLGIFAGRLPPRVAGLVIEWATLHRDALLDDWQRACAQKALEKIAPLE